MPTHEMARRATHVGCSAATMKAWVDVSGSFNIPSALHGLHRDLRQPYARQMTSVGIMRRYIGLYYWAADLFEPARRTLIEHGWSGEAQEALRRFENIVRLRPSHPWLDNEGNAASCTAKVFIQNNGKPGHNRADFAMSIGVSLPWYQHWPGWATKYGLPLVNTNVGLIAFRLLWLAGRQQRALVLYRTRTISRLGSNPDDMNAYIIDQFDARGMTLPEVNERAWKSAGSP